MAAVALARRLAAGTLQARGAAACVGLVSLDDYLAELEGLDIHAAEARGPIGAARQEPGAVY
jgi:hypothetical protein